MILPTHTTEQVCRELMEDHRWINADASKRFKKELKRLRASGMSSKTIDYQPELPSHNRWYVSATLQSHGDTPIIINKCCAVELGDGRRNFHIIRGKAAGRRYIVSVTGHVISRMKEREPQYRGLDGWKICLQIFRHDEFGGYAASTDPRAKDDENGCDSMFFTSSGVFLGKEQVGSDCFILYLQTFVRPDMLYTYEQQILYRQFVNFLPSFKFFKFSRPDGFTVSKSNLKTNADMRKYLDYIKETFDWSIEQKMFVIPPV